MPPFEIQVFVPSIRQPSAARVAAVRKAAASEPASGSDSANAAIASPLATFGSHYLRSASEPPNEMAPEPSPCMAKSNSASESWAASASRSTQRERDSTASNAPPHAEGTQYRR